MRRLKGASLMGTGKMRTCHSTLRLLMRLPWVCRRRLRRRSPFEEATNICWPLYVVQVSVFLDLKSRLGDMTLVLVILLMNGGYVC